MHQSQAFGDPCWGEAAPTAPGQLFELVTQGISEFLGQDCAFHRKQEHGSSPSPWGKSARNNKTMKWSAFGDDVSQDGPSHCGVAIQRHQ